MENFIKPIDGYEGLYSIDRDGVVYSHGRNGTRGGICRQWTSASGYPVVYLSKDDKSKTLKVHRLVAKAFIPNPDNKPQVNHKDGNKLNYSIDNLEWCTAQENIRHAHELGLSVHAKGYKAKDSRLTQGQRMQVVVMYAIEQLGQNDIASRFNVSQATISLVIREYLRNHLIDAGLAIDAATV